MHENRPLAATRLTHGPRLELDTSAFGSANGRGPSSGRAARCSRSRHLDGYRDTNFGFFDDVADDCVQVTGRAKNVQLAIGARSLP